MGRRNSFLQGGTQCPVAPFRTNHTMFPVAPTARPTTRFSQPTIDTSAITSPTPPDFIAETWRPHDRTAWRQAARNCVEADLEDAEKAAESLEWLSHHPVSHSDVGSDHFHEAQLDLSNMLLIECDLRDLVDWLQSRKLQVPIKINLADNDFNDDDDDDNHRGECGGFLVSLLEKQWCVSGLNLERCRLTTQAIIDICRALKNNTILQDLKLNGNRVAGCGEAIAAMLVENKTLRSLGLDSGLREFSGKICLSPEGVCAIVQALEVNSSLQVLNLGYHHYGAQGIQALADMLKKNKALFELDLDGENLQGGGLKTLCKALESGTVLEHLHLSYLRIVDEEMPALAKMLKKNKTLKHLYIPALFLDSQGKGNDKRFWASVGTNTSLRSLTIDNLICVEALANTLRNPMSHLETLHIFGSYIEDKDASILVDALQSNSTLLNFKGSLGSFVSPHVMQAIHAATRRNRDQLNQWPVLAGNALLVLLNHFGSPGPGPGFLPDDLRTEFGKAFKAMGDVPTMLNTIEAVTGKR